MEPVKKPIERVPKAPRTEDGAERTCKSEARDARRGGPIHPAKAYLRQVAQLRREIAETKELLSRLREQSTRATSRLSATRLSGTGGHDSMANAALKIIRNEEKLVEQIAHLEEAVAARMALIAQVEDPRERRVLELRYLHGFQEIELCRRMNLSAAQLWRVHGAALEHFRAVYEREQKGM